MLKMSDSDVRYRDGGQCQYCMTDNSVQIHHIVYRSHMPEDIEADYNKILLCANHHQGKVSVHSGLLSIVYYIHDKDRPMVIKTKILEDIINGGEGFGKYVDSIYAYVTNGEKIIIRKDYE